jgi:hypothetical protein
MSGDLESEGGRLVQAMLAYLIAVVGYTQVTMNPVGVPDFVLEGYSPTFGVGSN